jgi:dolichol-phosphate mannosyltransferase
VPADTPPLAITIVVPAFNEAANLPTCLACLHATFAGSRYEVIIVNDGSGDLTLEVARRLAAANPETVRVLSHPRNQGLGAALRSGFGAARGCYVTCCPADFQMGATEWEPFAVAVSQADVVVGCRRRREGYNLVMRFNSWLYPRLVRVLFGLRLRDVNWISVYRTELVRRVPITQTGIPMLVEILVGLRDLGATFREVDCTMQPRKIGTPSASRFRVMWRTLKGLLSFWWSYHKPSSQPSGTTIAQSEMRSRRHVVLRGKL